MMTVVGSGVMGDTLSPDDGIALLANMAATGAILVILIMSFGPISGAHFNPAVTLAFLLRGRIGVGLATLYALAQLSGAVFGTLSAHFMFDLELIQFSEKMRTGPSQWYSEFIATFGLLMVIFTTIRFSPKSVPYAVGLYISAAYWFTSSTSFANPAVTIARSLTHTFSGIFPGHAPAFVAAQFVAAVVATFFCKWLLYPPKNQKLK